MRNFKFFPANVAIGMTSNGERVTATPEFLRALEIVKDALGNVETPTVAQNSEPPAIAFEAAQTNQVTEALPALQVPTIGFETAWPIGSVFVSVVATDPSAMLGFGSWVQIGAGKFPVGFLAADPDFGTLGATGGAKTKAISAHAGTAVANHPDHTHPVVTNVTATTANFTAGAVPAVTSITNNLVTSSGASDGFTHSVTQPNDHTAVNVLPPFLVLNFWQRTA